MPINKQLGKTGLHQKHIPIAFCLYVVSRVEGFSMNHITYAGKNADDVFVTTLDNVARKIDEKFEESVPMKFGEEERKLNEVLNKCYACGKRFDHDDFKLRKVRDHCHFTGKFRGALHSKCNLKLKRTKTIPVLFHNLKGYDSHLFVKRLADTEGDFVVIRRTRRNI